MQGAVLFESAPAETTPPPLTPEQRQKLDLAFNTMREGCDEVMTVRSERAETYRWVAIGMAVAGSIAGGLVPVLTTASAAGNAEWIAGLGTISGAMNGLQSTMGNVGVSYDGESVTRQSFLTDWKATLDDYRDRRLKQDYDGAIVAIANASTTCVIYRTALNSRSVVNPLGTATASPAPSPSPSPSPIPSPAR